jgi:hypothetical protein
MSLQLQRPTPGPWIPEVNREGREVEVCFGREGADGWAQIVGKNRHANAALIKASPDLLATLEAAVEWAERENKLMPWWVSHARKAIAAARGPL